MSLSKSLAIIGVLLFALNGCGYQSLYGEQKTQRGTIIQADLSKIWIREIPDRPGQILHNELLSLFNSRGKPQNPEYVLSVSYTQSISDIGAGRDEFETRANLQINARFTLNGPVKLSGVSKSVVSYNILASPTGTEFSERNAQERALKEVARDIYRKVAVRLKNKQAEG